MGGVVEHLSWTGALGFLNWPFLALALATLAAHILRAVMSIFATDVATPADQHGTFSTGRGFTVHVGTAAKWTFRALIALTLIFIVGGAVLNLNAGIIGGVSRRLLPVWIALVVLFAASIRWKGRLGLYGTLFTSNGGMIGLALVMFWAFTGIFVAMGMIATHNPLAQMSAMIPVPPGSPVGTPLADGIYPHHLLGADAMARDVFLRMVTGALEVLRIAPLAPLVAFTVGITLGLPAGYLGGRVDTVLTFVSNLFLAFPAILLFFLLVTPEVAATGIPNYLAMVLFAFPIFLLTALFNTRLRTQPHRRSVVVGVILLIGIWACLSLISQPGTAIRILPSAVDPLDIPGHPLLIFASIVIVIAPAVFGHMRGLAQCTAPRAFVTAARMRGETRWYIVLWEVLPNARGPLIADFFARTGHATILLGALGVLGLGLGPDSPDWGTSIGEGYKSLGEFPHLALPPALALLSFVLGLNLIAEALRQEARPE